MNNADRLIELVRQNKQLKQITSVVPWEAIEPNERLALLHEAYKLSQSEPAVSYRLLQVLFGLAKDDLYKIQVLYLAVSHPHNDLAKRQDILKTMYRSIQTFTPSTGEEQKGKRRSWALYHYLNARTLLEAEKPQEALAEFYLAQDDYRQVHNQPYVDKIGLEIAQLQSKLGLGGSLQQSLPVQQEETSAAAIGLPARPAELTEVEGSLQQSPAAQQEETQAAVTALSARHAELTGTVAELQATVATLTDKHATLEDEISQAQATQRSLSTSVRTLTDEVAALEARKTALSREIAEDEQRKAELDREVERSVQQKAVLEQELADLEHKRKTSKSAPVERSDGFKGDLPSWLG